MFRQIKTNKGFTLIELLVVIVIVGVISGVIMVVTDNARIRARENRRISDLQTIRLALESYHAANHRTYPSTGNSWSSLYNCSGGNTPNWIPGLSPAYLPQLPRDPRNDTNCNHQYIYRSDGKDYKLLAQELENCAHIRSTNASLIDPIRGCTDGDGAIGYWTPAAQQW